MIVPAHFLIIPHADESRVSKAFSGVCDSVCLFVCPHDKTKTAETKLTKLGTGIVHHDTSPRSKKCKKPSEWSA